MRVRKQIPVQVNPQAPSLAQYRQGPILSNGALEFIYQKPVTWPLINFPTAIGIPTLQQFSIFPGAPQLLYNLALTTAPIYGAGVPAGQIELQGLEDDSE